MSHDSSPCVVKALIDEKIHHVSCGDAFTIACSKGTYMLISYDIVTHSFTS